VLSLARASGLRVVNAVPSVNQLIMKYAMGSASPADMTSEAHIHLNRILWSVGAIIPTVPKRSAS